MMKLIRSSNKNFGLYRRNVRGNIHCNNRPHRIYIIMQYISINIMHKYLQLSKRIIYTLHIIHTFIISFFSFNKNITIITLMLLCVDEFDCCSYKYNINTISTSTLPPAIKFHFNIIILIIFFLISLNKFYTTPYLHF